MAVRHWVELGEYMDLSEIPDCSISLDQAA
jgi:hypothetical protein